MSIPGSSESSSNILQWKDVIAEVSLASGENIIPNVNSSSDEEDETGLYQFGQSSLVYCDRQLCFAAEQCFHEAGLCPESHPLAVV